MNQLKFRLINNDVEPTTSAKIKKTKKINDFRLVEKNSNCSTKESKK